MTRWHALVLLAVMTAVVGCVSTDGLTDEEKREVYRAYLAEAKAYVEEAKPIAQLYVDKGKLKQEEVDVAFATLEDVAIPLLEAAIEGNDTTAWAQARAKVVLGIAKIVIMLTLDDAEAEATPPAPAPGTVALTSRTPVLPKPPRAPHPPPLPQDL